MVFKPFRYISIKSDVPENERGLRRGRGKRENVQQDRMIFFCSPRPKRPVSARAGENKEGERTNTH